MIEVISATRGNWDEFQRTPLGRSLHRLRHDPRLTPVIAYSNGNGLPEVYNARIEAESADDILLFIHDDVWIDDFFVVTRILEGLKRFDLLGVAGNQRMAESHVTWFRNHPGGEFDYPHLSGQIGHGPDPFGEIAYYGETPAECRLMDGVFLAARRSQLKARGVAFDPRFTFQFYALDFCRTAFQQGMTIGTWPIAITHASVGAFGTPAWKSALQVYREKWS